MKVKLKCIENRNHLTVGNTYEPMNIYFDQTKVINDCGWEEYFPSNIFEPIAYNESKDI
jgi:hypothetical protein